MIGRHPVAIILILVLLTGTSQSRVTLAGPSPSPEPLAPATPSADDDHDGINDALEQRLAEKYAPVVYIEPDESNYPVNVDWFLARAHLQYHEDCFNLVGQDVDDDFGPTPISTQLLGPYPGAVWAGGPNCGEDDTGYSHPPHRELTTIAADPDGQFSVASLTTGYSDQQTFVLTDLPDSEHVGSRDPHDWVTYFHAYPSADGGVMIQYWHVFAYNEFGGGFDNHGGDWDASIQVQLFPDLTLNGVWFSRHADDHPGKFFPVDSNDLVRLYGGTHPVVTIDGGGHAAFRSPDDWATCHCRVGESITGPIGTVVWTPDTAAYNDPASLRKAVFLCTPNVGCTTYLSDDQPGGIDWETWSSGSVRSSGDLTEPLSVPTPSAHGGLVNLGEYNPCTPVKCFGSAQASKLLAGEFHPLNNSWWLQFEGRWGSIGRINSGPRDPIFQGFEDRGQNSTSIYTAWYNAGSDTPATGDGTFPWRVPPSTASAFQGTSFTAGGTTYVSGSTRISLSARQNSVASGYGTLATFYRVYQASDFAPPFNAYTGSFSIANPFPVASPNVAYKVDYYSVDGLGNTEDIHTLTLTLDTTSPTVSINQPAALCYTHSSTLTLDYSATDSGSGLRSVAALMDGAATLGGHGLLSGQPINLLTDLPAGSHTFSVEATDNVGNSRLAPVTFQIVVTPSSIKADVTQFVAAGKIRGGGFANSLTALLDAAAAGAAKGNCQAAASNYAAFINLLRAQTGKAVDADAAQIMAADAQYLISHCPAADTTAGC